MRAGTEMGLIHRLGGGFGSSYRLGIGCSVTADQNEITAKRRVSGYRAHFSRQSSSMLTRDVRRSSSGGTIVAMIQTTQPWHRCHLVTDARSFPCFTTRRRFLFQREMCAILEIVADVFFHQAFQLPLRMTSHLTLKNTPPVMRDDEKAVEHSEGQHRDGKQIHRGDGFPMIAEKGRPSLGRLRTLRRSPHPAQHGSLGKIEAKHFQFAVDTRCATCGIFRDHAKDQLTQFLADAFSARPNPTLRQPRPIQLEPCTVPANDSLWLDED